MDKLTVSIVNFNGGNFLIECLKSLMGISEKNMQIFLTDNNSTDKSLDKAEKLFSKVKFFKNLKNLGFGKAQNQVLKKVDGEFVLILNPDCKILPGTVEYMLEFMKKNPEVGAASCKVQKKNGSIDWASHRGFPTPWASFKYYILGDDSLYHLRGKDMLLPHEVDSISGAFFLTRKSVLDKVGLFDEDFFMYGEDIDLCLRIKKAGYKIMYVPSVKIIHYKGISSGVKKHSLSVSSANLKDRARAFDAFYLSMKIFYKKHYEKMYPFLINWLVLLGINLKWWLAKRKMIV